MQKCNGGGGLKSGALYLTVGLFLFPASGSLAVAMRSYGIPHVPLLLVAYACLLALSVVCLRQLPRNAPVAVWVLMYIILLVTVLGLMRSPDPIADSGEILPGVFLGLIWMLAMSSIPRLSDLLILLPWAGGVLLFSTIVQLIISRTDGGDQVSYSQYLGYQILPAVIFLTDYSLGARRRLPVLLAGVSWVTLLAMGARGPALAAFLYLGIRLALKLRAKPIGAIATLSIAGLAVFYAAAVGRWLEAIFARLGLSTRVLDRQRTGSLFSDDSRVKLVSESLMLIREHPFVGMGMGNERRILASRLEPGAESSVGWYPHNVLLELLLHFGLVLGSAMVVILLWRTFRFTIDEVHPDRARMTLIFISLGLFPLMVSATYLDWPWFFGLLGILVRPAIEYGSGLRRVSLVAGE